MAADTATKEKPDVKKKALAKRPEPATQVALGPVLTYEDLIRQADDFIKTGFLPTAIKTPQQAVAIVLMGRELGVPMMQSLREIYVVAGKPTLSGQMMLGLARSTREVTEFKIVADNTKAVCTIRRNQEAPHTETFTIDDAKRMSLIYKDNWKK